MRTATLVLVAGALAMGCKKKPADSVENATGAPASTVEIDALWALAPEGATIAIVASPRAVAMAEHAWLDVRRLLATAPELSSINTMLGKELQQIFAKQDVTLADLGLTPTKGGAFFVAPGGGGIAIIPVGDRDKFLAAAHGTKGADSDTVGKATCKTINGTYICASSDDMFAKVGKAKMRSGLDAVGARGDLEVVSNVPILGTPTPIAGVVQLARGAFTMRAVVSGVPTAMISRFSAAQIKPRAPADKTAGFGVINLAPVLSTMPPIPLVTGVSLADLARSLGGPVTLHIPPGSPEIDVRIPVTDPAPASTLIEHCTEIPPLAAAGATFSDGACHLTVPSFGYTLDIFVDGKEIRIGKKGGTAAGVAVPMTALGAELAQSEAAFAFWGRGTVYAQPLVPMPKLPIVPAQLLTTIRSVSLLNEMGGSVRIDGDKIKIIFAVRTAWSNPDDVVAKLAEVSPETFFAGTAGDATKSIAEGAPGSPFAADYKAGPAGLMTPTAVVGILAAVAVPAFMDYMKKGKKTEASLMMLRIARSAQAAYVADGAFPIGDAPLTPARSMCENHGKRDTDMTVWDQEMWKKLDFLPEEPTLFQYRVHSDGKTLEAEAVGDLDCDGITISYKMHAVGGAGTPVVTFEEPQPNTD
jgi:type IV pilus assembly protein PilA